jgi:sugar lactone lactonase YvrE
MTTSLAPNLHSSLNWLNADAQTIAAQRGRVLALVFWNASSAYCHNLIDELNRLKARYPFALAVLGIHLPKFDAEVDDRTVLKAMNRLGVGFAVANDRGWVTWQHFGISCWPSVALINPDGELREIFSGDDQASALDGAISALIDEVGGPTSMPAEEASLRGSEPRLPLSFPSGITVTDTHLYVADTGHHRVLECTFEGRVLRQFGTGYADLVDGPASEAAFSSPRGLCVLRDAVFVADAGNHALRRIHLDEGRVETLVGTGKAGQPQEGTLTNPGDCQLNQPWAVAGAYDRLFIAVAGCNQIWEYELGHSRVRFVAGTGELGIADGPGRNAVFAHPAGLALVQQTLYVADAASSALRSIHLQGNVVETLVGHGLYEFGERDGRRRDARLQMPLGLALDPVAPVLWVADSYNGGLRKLRLGGGEMSTHNLSHPLNQPAALAIGGNALWIADAGAHEVMRQDMTTGSLTRLPLDEYE